MTGRQRRRETADAKQVLRDPHAAALGGTASWREPFDVAKFRNEPTPRVFDPEEAATASEPFDVDEFIQTIREGRDAGRAGGSRG